MLKKKQVKDVNKFWNRLKIQPTLGIQRFSGSVNLKSMLQTQKILEGKQETQGVRMRDLPSAGLGVD